MTPKEAPLRGMTEEERQKWVLDQINEEMKKVNQKLEDRDKEKNLTFEEFLYALFSTEPK